MEECAKEGNLLADPALGTAVFKAAGSRGTGVRFFAGNPQKDNETVPYVCIVPSASANELFYLKDVSIHISSEAPTEFHPIDQKRFTFILLCVASEELEAMLLQSACSRCISTLYPCVQQLIPEVLHFAASAEEAPPQMTTDKKNWASALSVSWTANSTVSTFPENGF
jgi:hypothetical protein